ncbi:uncharacterized protein LOC111707249 [Eurytemora carolleeae]|uniref:uncharacterized protein LOC111707249 n=1 Tax=Eurytemora carolleeae TaxID=1294199 RepID=UPI000C75AF6A|nr:uncharacterized protein LOC111707249 [Eurytemora carolleeae]|eukprot:XP_023336083.1 uncharacterized protein LOC111707249 [Eurytemora affinis]
MSGNTGEDNPTALDTVHKLIGKLEHLKEIIGTNSNQRFESSQQENLEYQEFAGDTSYAFLISFIIIALLALLGFFFKKKIISCLDNIKETDREDRGRIFVERA